MQGFENNKNGGKQNGRTRKIEHELLQKWNNKITKLKLTDIAVPMIVFLLHTMVEKSCLLYSYMVI